LYILGITGDFIKNGGEFMGFATINAIAREIRKEQERHKAKMEALKKKKGQTARGMKW